MAVQGSRRSFRDGVRIERDFPQGSGLEAMGAPVIVLAAWGQCGPSG